MRRSKSKVVDLIHNKRASSVDNLPLDDSWSSYVGYVVNVPIVDRPSVMVTATLSPCCSSGGTSWSRHCTVLLHTPQPEKIRGFHDYPKPEFHTS